MLDNTCVKISPNAIKKFGIIRTNGFNWNLHGSFDPTSVACIHLEMTRIITNQIQGTPDLVAKDGKTWYDFANSKRGLGGEIDKSAVACTNNHDVPQKEIKLFVNTSKQAENISSKSMSVLERHLNIL